MMTSNRDWKLNKADYKYHDEPFRSKHASNRVAYHLVLIDVNEVEEHVQLDVDRRGMSDRISALLAWERTGTDRDTDAFCLLSLGH
jgi:hypothetical protein